MGKNTRLRMLARNGALACAVEPDGDAGGATVQPATPAPAPADSEDQQGDPADLGDAGKKALAAERKRADEAEKRAKALTAQLEEKENSSLSETELLRKQFEEMSSKYEEERRTGFRKDAASAAELPAFLARQIEGDSYESMLESAKALKSEFDSELTARTKPGTPIPDPSQGSHPPLDAVAHSAPGAPRMAAAFEQQLNTRK